MPKATLSASRPTQIIEYSHFRGVDFSSNPGDVAEYRSPDSVNMISDQDGRIVKRFGYELMTKVKDGDRINGIHRLVRRVQEDGVYKVAVYFLVHAGTKLYKWDLGAQYYAPVLDFEMLDFNNLTFNDDLFDPETRGDMGDMPICEDMADTRSMAFQMEEELWILDGKLLRYFDGETVGEVADRSYVPETGIGMSPTGGSEVGTHRDRNLLSPYAINSFQGTASDKTYQLNTTQVEKIESCTVLNDSGEWVSAAFTTPSAADLKKGQVRFTAAPGVSPIGGVDNVRIKFKKTIADGIRKINQCTVGILWGMGGNNRMVLSGNPQYPNMVFTSEIGGLTGVENPEEKYPAPSYFPELGYSLAGEDSSKVVGFLRMGDELAILKEDNSQNATVYMQRGILTDDFDLLISTREGVAGVGAISPYSMCDLRDDPLFLSSQGVFALATNDVTSTRCAQPRSERVNSKLCRETDLEKAVAVEHDGYWYLAVNGHVYVADSAQREYLDTTGQQCQYEWYYWDDVPARVWFKHAGRLWFGTEDGRVMRFYDTKESTAYSDDGEAIRAYWTTPELAFDSYTIYKTLRRVYTKVVPFSKSSVKVLLKDGGGFEQVDYKQADLFGFDSVDFGRLTFNTDRDVGVIATKVKKKRVITTQVRLMNDDKNEPFGLTSIAIYYDTQSKVK